MHFIKYNKKKKIAVINIIYGLHRNILAPECVRGADNQLQIKMNINTRRANHIKTKRAKSLYRSDIMAHNKIIFYLKMMTFVKIPHTTHTTIYKTYFCVYVRIMAHSKIFDNISNVAAAANIHPQVKKSMRTRKPIKI